MRVAVSLLKDCCVQLVLRRNSHESFNGVLYIKGKCILLLSIYMEKSFIKRENILASRTVDVPWKLQGSRYSVHDSVLRRIQDSSCMTESTSKKLALRIQRSVFQVKCS